MPLIGTVGYKGCVDVGLGADSVIFACGAEGRSGVGSCGGVLISYEPIDVRLGMLLMLGTLLEDFILPAEGAEESDMVGNRGMLRGGTLRGFIRLGPVRSFGPRFE